MKKLIKRYTSTNLIIRISIGLLVGTTFGLICNYASNNIEYFKNDEAGTNFLLAVNVLFQIFGNLFIGALRAIAPVLVFFLISSSIMNSVKQGSKTIQKTMALYAAGTFLSALVSVIVNTSFNVQLALPSDVDTSSFSSASSMDSIIVNIFNSIVANPIDSIANANFLGVLFWSILFGACAQPLASKGFKEGFKDISNVLTKVVRIIIEFAPFGICGLVFMAILDNGVGIFTDYGMLLCVYLVCVLTIALIVNPLLCFIVLRKNPYPLIFRTIKEVGITAFFMRSSAANIPVNMKYCEKLHLDKTIYSITIPLGSTINMEGTSVTIITLTLACCSTLGINVDFGPALILSVIAAVCAIGASGVSGGSILLVPMACSLFGIGSDISAAVVAVGFIIGVIQDSVETALNSSTDALFTATIQLGEQIKKGVPYHKIVGGTLDDKKEVE